ncbi:hypothetical protein DF011_15295 [Burkholderia ubonensis]|nr:hypothetical protein CJO70_09730 [Burkholderia ubonensis]PAK08280.1 hypothetical protein CJO67_08240 [Burkholderia ubonensis]RQP69762.1 hypothetical protein DF013_24640 [Burkholderia ubonensis]RQQ11939.1 hypothetical protein DF011_15295 [Burkholderia ubonensis]
MGIKEAKLFIIDIYAVPIAFFNVILVLQEVIEALAQALDLVSPDTGGDVGRLLDVLVYFIGFRKSFRDARDAALVNNRETYLILCSLHAFEMDKNNCPLICVDEQSRNLVHHAWESAEFAGQNSLAFAQNDNTPQVIEHVLQRAPRL